jgi:hypothetical protein
MEPDAAVADVAEPETPEAELAALLLTGTPWVDTEFAAGPDKLAHDWDTLFAEEPGTADKWMDILTAFA